jgi:hypothetical protein
MERKRLKERSVMTISCISQSTRQIAPPMTLLSRSRIDTQSFITTTGYASKNQGKVSNR